MAWGSSTQVGCGFSRNCPPRNGFALGYVVCQYRQM
ncbi:unnamed protein product [Anisakis simplex]|uniref:SCP domain-containing protein n=1 Tax=Anisakis simplex TaxID=6269 RepID=A0A0M3J8P2_ANISI|nr:unnamed protein product [Anisakis simplex]